MCFTTSLHSLQVMPTFLSPAGVIEKQVPQYEPSEEQDALPPPLKFQRKCKCRNPPADRLIGHAAQTVAVQHCGPHGASATYAKSPIRDSDLCPARAGEYTIEESVQIFEYMMDAANEFLVFSGQHDPAT
jgi:hypothetical protein